MFREIITRTHLITKPILSREKKSLRGPWEIFSRQCTLPGSGAGKGGGGGGTIKDAGGGMGRFGAAQEEGYFYNREKEKLTKLKKQLKEDPKLRLKDKKEDK